MAEKGLVVDKKEDLVVIKMTRTEACAKCRACIAGMSTKDMLVEADNECSAKVGDWVEMELRGNTFLTATLIMYGLPLVGLLFGVVLGYFVISPFLPQINQELLSFIVGILFTGLVFYWIKSQESRWASKKFRPVAVKIATETNENE